MASASSRTCSVFLGFDDEEFSETMRGLAWSHDGPEFSPRIELMSFEIDLSTRFAADAWRRVVLACGQLAAAVNPLRLRCGKISGHATDGQRALTVEIQGGECAAVRELVIALFAQARLAQASDDASFEPHASLFCARARNGAVAPPPWSSADWPARAGRGEFEGRSCTRRASSSGRRATMTCPRGRSFARGAWRRLRARCCRARARDERTAAGRWSNARAAAASRPSEPRRARGRARDGCHRARDTAQPRGHGRLRRLAARATHCTARRTRRRGPAATRRLRQGRPADARGDGGDEADARGEEPNRAGPAAMANKLAARNHQVRWLHRLVAAIRRTLRPPSRARPRWLRARAVTAQLGDGAAQ